MDEKAAVAYIRLVSAALSGFSQVFRKSINAILFIGAGGDRVLFSGYR